MAASPFFQNRLGLGRIDGLLTTAALFLAAKAFALAPPATFTRAVATSTDSVVVDFVHHPIRSGNFEVLVQDAAGAFTARMPDEPRTYLGTVQGRPGAVAAGWLKDDGTLLCRISFESGVEWSSTGGVAGVRGTTSWTPAWPTSVVGAGGAGPVVRAAEVGVDAAYDQFVACGSNVNATVAMAEFCVMASNVIYLRDAAILHRVGKIVIRSSEAADPYEPHGGDTGLLLPELRTQWTSVIPVGTTHDLALVAKPGAGGGLAYVGTIGTASRYSANGTDANGDFTVIWRHEAGHNWSSSHYEGGGKPEGPTIMSDNSLSRFSSSELARIIAHRNTKASILDNLGAYAFPLPPRANMDRAVFLTATPVTVDVLSNDSDSNGETVTLTSFPDLSAAGGTLTRSTGSGPGGRDQITYTPPAGFTRGTDSFSYRITDASGKPATGYVTVRPIAEGLSPVDHWPLDESSGAVADNLIRSLDGTHNGALAGQSGANAVTTRGVYFDGSNDRTSIPAPNYNSATLTFTTWVRRDGAQTPWAPFLFTRAGSSVAGFGFGDGNELRYTWNDAGQTFAPSPVLTVPDGEWCFAAMVVTPTGVTLHLRTAAGLQSATHTAAITSEAFNGTMYLARDNTTPNRYFKGWLDDVRVYNQPLTADHIESLYQQAASPPQIAIVNPGEGDAVSPLNVEISADVEDGGYLLGGVEFLDGTTSLGTVDVPPFAKSIAAMTPGPHTLVARASFGDWGYRIASPPVAFTALPPPLPVVTLGTAGIPSRSGPVAAEFVITRSHPIGSLTVPFTISGSAISGTDYVALPDSVTLPDGTLSAAVTLTPVAAPPGEAKTVTLTASPTAALTIGSPAAATLAIDDHFTSIIDGTWNTGTTWTSGSPAPVTGTQNTGDDYVVAHVVTSNATNSNAQALFARSLRIEQGGVLDLARLHDGTNVNVSYNLPVTRLENGGAIRFRASNGSSTHTVSAAITNAGATSLRINGGNYANAATLTGALSGSGTIAIVSESGYSVTGDIRQLSVTSANNAFSGNWTVTHNASGDDFAALRAGAANALGSGTVTIGTRSRLVNDNASGLNSLAGVVMTGATSSLLLNQPWTNANASLALTGGSPAVTLGNAASSIGNLSGSTGTLAGSGASSALTVQQAVDGSFGGNLGTSLKFTKAGAAMLRLTGTLDPSLRLTLSDGKLGFGENAATVASFNHGDGDLLLLPGKPLTVTGNYVHTGGGLLFTAGSLPTTGIPYLLVRYQGTLSGQPGFTFAGPSDHGLVAVVNYGSGTNSQITATFQPADPFPAWIAGYDLEGDDALDTADPDGDGLANREEMLFGFDPTSADSRLQLSVVSLEQTTARLKLNRVITAGTFTVESSATLQIPWTSLPLAISADADELEFEVPRHGAQRFYRVVFQGF